MSSTRRQQLFNVSYEQFIEQSKYFKDGLKKGNPFILRIHLVRIHDLAKSDDLSDEQKLAQVDLLLTSQNYIAAMDSEHCGKFKCLADSYAKYQTAALLNSLTPKNRPEELILNAEELYFSAIELLEMVTKKKFTQDISMTLYGHQEMEPEFPFTDTHELIDLIKSKLQVARCNV